MEGCLVVGHQVDGFDNVDFAIVRPQGAFRPERWPDRATVWDVDEVYDPEGAPVVEVLTGNPDLCAVATVHEQPQRPAREAQREAALGASMNLQSFGYR